MKIIIVRHAVAEDKVLFAKKNVNDDLRPLTTRGKSEFIKNSKVIKKIYPSIDKILTSPLTRAMQTAEILEARYKMKSVIIEELRPGKDFSRLLKKIAKFDRPVLVGHEPFLGEFIGYMVGSSHAPVVMKKGGVCVLECEVLKAGGARIYSHLSPKILGIFT